MNVKMLSLMIFISIKGCKFFEDLCCRPTQASAREDPEEEPSIEEPFIEAPIVYDATPISLKIHGDLDNPKDKYLQYVLNNSTIDYINLYLIEDILAFEKDKTWIIQKMNSQNTLKPTPQGTKRKSCRNKHQLVPGLYLCHGQLPEFAGTYDWFFGVIIPDKDGLYQCIPRNPTSFRDGVDLIPMHQNYNNEKANELAVAGCRRYFGKPYLPIFKATSTIPSTAVEIAEQTINITKDANGEPDLCVQIISEYDCFDKKLVKRGILSELVYQDGEFYVLPIKIKDITQEKFDKAKQKSRDSLKAHLAQFKDEFTCFKGQFWKSEVKSSLIYPQEDYEDYDQSTTGYIKAGTNQFGKPLIYKPTNKKQYEVFLNPQGKAVAYRVVDCVNGQYIAALHYVRRYAGAFQWCKEDEASTSID